MSVTAARTMNILSMVQKDRNLVSENIKKGVTILGVEGTAEVITTESTVTVGDSTYIVSSIDGNAIQMTPYTPAVQSPAE